MKALRTGPSNRGPFQGPPPIQGRDPIGVMGDSRLSDNPPKPRAWQTGAMDLAVNVAILAVAAGAQVYIARAPTFVCAPTPKPWAQTDTYHNVAVNAQTIRPDGAYIEPQIWRPKPAAPDVLPNIAVNLQTVKIASSPEPTLSKRLWAQVDLYPNVAITRQSIQPGINGAPEPTLYKRSAQIDLAPNVAATAVPPVYAPPAVLDPVLFKRLPPQIDVYPNIVAQVSIEPGKSIPTLEWTLAARKWTAPDLAPNVAVSVAVPAYRPPALADITLSPRKWTQPDLFPNISFAQETVPVIRAPLYTPYKQVRWATPDLPPNVAASVVVGAVYVPPAPVEPTYFKRPPPQIDVIANVAVMLSPSQGNVSDFNSLPGRAWVQPDLFPNLAVNAAPPVIVPPPFVEPTYTKRISPVPDVYPNIAATVPPPQPVLIEPIDPTLTKRVWAQVDVFQNQAIYAPQVAVQLPYPVEPTYTKRYWPQIDVLPNIAVNFNNIPAPPAPPLGSNAPTGGGGGGGKRDWPDHGYRHEEKPGKVLSLDQADAIVEAQTAAPQIVAKPPTPEVGARLVSALTVVDRAAAEEQDDEEALILLLRGL
jgi:hypothetical protein